MFFVYVFEEDFEEFNERSFYTSCEEILIVRGDSNWLGRYYIRNMSIDTVRWLFLFIRWEKSRYRDFCKANVSIEISRGVFIEVTTQNCKYQCMNNGNRVIHIEMHE